MPQLHYIGLSPSEVEGLELDALAQDVLIGDSHTLIISPFTDILQPGIYYIFY